MMGAPKGHKPYPGCEKGGRPVEWTDEKLDDLANKLNDWLDKDKSNIFIEDFADLYRINEKYFYELIKKNKKLSDSYERFRSKQRSTIVKGALTKKFNHNTMVWMMNINHGIYQKTETTETEALKEATIHLNMVMNELKELKEKKNSDQ